METNGNFHAIKNADSILCAARLRKTTQRLHIVEMMITAQRPLSPDDIYRKASHSPVNRATVYRIIHTLQNASVLHHAFTRGRTSYYELANHCSEEVCHPHFTCMICGHTTCFFNTHIPAVTTVPEGFRIHNRKLMLTGICPTCHSSQAALSNRMKRINDA